MKERVLRMIRPRHISSEDRDQRVSLHDFQQPHVQRRQQHPRYHPGRKKPPSHRQKHRNIKNVAEELRPGRVAATGLGEEQLDGTVRQVAREARPEGFDEEERRGEEEGERAVEGGGEGVVKGTEGGKEGEELEGVQEGSWDGAAHGGHGGRGGHFFRK